MILSSLGANFLKGFGNSNFQSGFGNTNDIADSLGSLIGFGPEDRTSVLARSSEQVQEVIKEVLTILEFNGKSKALAYLDDYMRKEAINLSKMKSANSKASGKQKKEQLTAFRLELLKYNPDKQDVSNFVKNDVKSKSNFLSDEDAQNVDTSNMTNKKSDNKLIFIGLAIVVFWSSIKKILKIK